jgi:mRNA interferase RelE/StbE
VAKYDIQVRPSVWKDVAKIPKKDLRKILVRIESLRDEPRSAASVKLSGWEHYRIRQGDYRIGYEIDANHSIVTVAKVGHRGDVYRKK